MTSDYYEAIFFFDNQNVAKEMRYNEFESVLDGVVGIPELAGKRMEAGYLSMTSMLQITSCVLFLIQFNSKGFADTDWNIPLRHLASKGRAGPNLGAGPIRLACQSQCAIAWYQKELWEPPTGGNFDLFGLIQRAITRNKLGFKKIPTGIDEVNIPVISDVVSPNASQATLQEQKKETESRVNEVRLQAAQKIQQLEKRHSDELEQVSRAFRNEKVTFQEQIRSIEHKFREQSVFHDTLKSKYLELQSDHDKMRMDNTLCKERIAHLQESNDALTEERIAQKGSVEAQESSLNEKNKVLSVNLEAERKRVSELKEKLAFTEADKRQMVQGFVQRLKELDLLFVAYHLGAGHISFSVDVLQEYSDNPEYFAAQKCQVSLEHYQQWVTHYELPQCDMCGKKLPRIDNPGDFVAGSHNFCDQHKKPK